MAGTTQVLSSELITGMPQGFEKLSAAGQDTAAQFFASNEARAGWEVVGEDQGSVILRKKLGGEVRAIPIEGAGPEQIRVVGDLGLMKPQHESLGLGLDRLEPPGLIPQQRPPQPSGTLGLAQTIRGGPVPTSGSTSAVAPAERTPGGPTFRGGLKGIGQRALLGIGEAGAMLAGIEGPAAMIRKNRERAVKEALEREGKALAVFDRQMRAVEALGKLPPGAAYDAALESWSKMLNQLEPGAGDVLGKLAKEPYRLEAVTQGLIEHSPSASARLQVLGLKGTLEWMTSGEGRDVTLTENLPRAITEARQKMPDAFGWVRKEEPDTLDEMRKGAFTWQEFIELNGRLPREYQLSPATMLTLGEAGGPWLKEQGILVADLAQERSAKSVKLSSVNLETPDGERHSGRELEDGTLQLRTDDGGWMDAPAGTQRAGVVGEREPQRGVNLVVPGVGVRMSFDGGRTVMIGGERVPAPEGSYIFTGEAQGQLEDVAGAVGKGEAGKAGAAAREGVGDLVQATSLLRQLERVGPGAVGVRGKLSEEVGGVLMQLDDVLGGETGRMIGEKIAGGASSEEVTAFRQAARAFVAGSVPDLTGEESGRITERELEITREATRIDVLTGSYDQVKAAIEQAIVLRIARLERQALIAGIEPEFDLSTDEGFLGQANKLERMGLSDPQRVLDTIDIMQQQRTLLGEVGVTAGQRKP